MGTEEPDFLLRMILEKLDALDRKIDGPHGLVSHEVRLAAVENSKRDNRAVWAAASLAALSWVPDIMQLLGK